MNERRNIKQKINLFIGTIGAFIGVAVFVAYIPQIMANIEGHKAQPWQPLFAAGSCLIWVVCMAGQKSLSQIIFLSFPIW